MFFSSISNHLHVSCIKPGLNPGLFILHLFSADVSLHVTLEQSKQVLFKEFALEDV